MLRPCFERLVCPVIGGCAYCWEDISNGSKELLVAILNIVYIERKIFLQDYFSFSFIILGWLFIINYIFQKFEHRSTFSDKIIIINI